MSRRIPALLALFAVTIWLGCETQESVLNPNAPEPSLDLLDATQELGSPHFFWLPPMVSEPSCEGVFDDSLEPVVTICAVGGGCFEPFTMTSGPGSETVRVVPEDQHYVVNWHTDEFALTPGGTYRIEVSVAGTPLGFADVLMASGGELKNLDTQGSIPLKDGRTLPVKFRIEDGAVSVVGSTGGTINAECGNTALVIPSGALDKDYGITILPHVPKPGDPELIPGPACHFGPEGLKFDVPAILTMRYDDPQGADERALLLHTLGEYTWIPMPGGLVAPGQKAVTSEIELFSIFGIGSPELECALAGIEIALFQNGMNLACAETSNIGQKHCKAMKLLEYQEQVDLCSFIDGFESLVSTFGNICGGIAVEGPWIDVQPGDTRLEPEATITLSAVPNLGDEVATGVSDVAWTSLNPEIATVLDGVATAVAPGNALIVAEALEDPLLCGEEPIAFHGWANVTVEEPETDCDPDLARIEVRFPPMPEELSSSYMGFKFYVGDQVQLSATVKIWDDLAQDYVPTDCLGSNIQWKLQDCWHDDITEPRGYVSLDATGLVTALKAMSGAYWAVAYLDEHPSVYGYVGVRSISTLCDKDGDGRLDQTMKAGMTGCCYSFWYQYEPPLKYLVGDEESLARYGITLDNCPAYCHDLIDITDPGNWLPISNNFCIRECTTGEVRAGSYKTAFAGCPVWGDMEPYLGPPGG